MEIIKKQVKQKVIVFTGDTGVTIIPDTGVSYNFKVNLTSTDFHLGYFNAVEDENITGFTGTTAVTINLVTGVTISRINEIRKFTNNPNPFIRYITGGTLGTFGLNIGESITSTTGTTILTYYLGNIKYQDFITANTTYLTTYEYTASGSSVSNLFDDLPYHKNENILDVVRKPKVVNNVFIDRQSVSVLENNLRLKSITNLSELLNYAGGNYFNIVDNT